MGESVLETGFKKQGARPPIHYQEPITGANRRYHRSPTTEGEGNDSGSLAMWGWDQSLTDWNDEQITLLSAGWRQSTLNRYRPAWRR